MPVKESIKKLTLLLIIALIVLSVYGAFIGTERAVQFFTSLPLIIYWALFAVLTVLAVIVFATVRRLGVFLTHIGLVLVIAGSFLASEKFAFFLSKNFNQPLPPSGNMVIYEGSCQSGVYDRESGQSYQLDFEIRLNDFIIQHYPGQIMQVKDYVSKVDVIKDGKVVKSADIEVNRPLSFGGFCFYQYGCDEKGSYTVLQVMPDSGTHVLFAGFGFLFFGLVWHLWFVKLRKSLWK